MEVQAILDRFQIEYIDGGGEWIKVTCPFHPDTSPSGNVNVKSGKFICRTDHCGKKGDVFDLVAGVKNTSRAIIRELCKVSEEELTEKDVIPAHMIEQWHQSLLTNNYALKILRERKGLTVETVRRFRLGFVNRRIGVPIRAADGSYVNVRLWSWEAKKAEYKVINAEGHGKRRLFPINSLESDTVIITEGEMKALYLIQLGYAATSPTGGSSTWSKGWSKLFEGKHVILIYDIDKPGRSASLRRCRELFRFAASIKNVLLPMDIKEHPTGDVIDFFIKCNQTKKDLDRVIAETTSWSPTPLRVKLPDDEKIYEVELCNSSQAEYYNKFCKIDCVVSAKDMAPYIVPKLYQVSCTKDQDYCAICPVSQSTGEHEVEIDDKDPALLELVNTRVAFQNDALKRIAGIPRRCQVCQFTMKQTYNIEEVRLIPQLKIASNQREHVVRRAFYVGHGIETNTAYAVEGRCIPEPNTQYATLLCYKAIPQVDSLSVFKLDDEIRKQLEVFHCDHSLDAVQEKLDEIYTDLEDNVTHIYQRRDMHMTYDMCYHSPLYIPFQERIHKGWVETLIIGDSGQGKSETLRWMMAHYGLGEKVDSKGSSIAGILGGLQETAKRWFITWGVLPLNDRGLVAFEEAKGMPIEVISKMTDARSSGIVEISKIEKARTNCRCRLIWVSNPRSQRQLSTYNYGVEAIKELIGSLEDVRRFDVAIAVASGDVPSNVINRTKRSSDTPHKHVSRACQNLLLWAWSRSPKQVIFTDDAVQAIFRCAEEMGERYSSAIPLVELSDQRLKVARLSASLAARLFSCDESGENLVIHEAHVHATCRYLHRVYSSPALGYLEYSKLIKGEATLDDETVVRKVITKTSYPRDTIRAMLDTNLISISDWQDWTGQSIEEAKHAVGTLVRKRALKRYRTAYIKTPPFLNVLKDMNVNGQFKEVEKPTYVEEDL